MYQGKDSKFGTNYYKQKYIPRLCKLKKEDDTKLKKILKKNKLGYTEFIKFCIDYFKDSEINMRYFTDKEEEIEDDNNR